MIKYLTLNYIFQNLTVSTFIQSVPMSTYLVAFLVSDFGFTVDVNNKDYKIWHQVCILDS